MKRFALILAVVGILCVSAGQAMAHSYHHGHGGYRHGSVVVRPYSYWAAPPVVVHPRVVYPPVYRYRYYDPCPSFGFHYEGRGVSVGVGF